MLLIWGFKVRSKLLGSAQFFCPHEGGDRGCCRMQARRWFTFFWIPLIPLKVLGEYIECTSCGSTYDPQVLTMPTAAQMEDQLTRAVRHVVVAMLHADEHVDDHERKVAIEVVSHFGHADYDAVALDQDLASLQVTDLEDELVGVAAMLSPQGQESLLRACLTLAGADGHVDERELKAITHAGRALGMSAAHVRGVLAELTEQAQPPTPN